MSREFRNIQQIITAQTPIEELRKLYLQMSDTYRQWVSFEVFSKYAQSKQSILWHDYEGWGADPTYDQPSQFAAIRTNLDLEIIDIPIDIYCKPTMDKFPHPIAVQITHISPLHCLEFGLPEYEFITEIKNEAAIPGTIFTAYNGMKYDRVMTRFTLFRNLLPAYEHEFQNGNTTWDILPLTAITRALRPEGINWPLSDEGKPTVKLELLSKSNNIVQENAHNAVDDVKATIDFAKLLKQNQPKLWDYILSIRSKKVLVSKIKLRETPYVLAAMAFGGDNNFIKPVTPLFELTNEPGTIIAVDLSYDFEAIKGLSADEVRSRLYAKKDELTEKGLTRPGIIKIKLNTAPAIAPVTTVRAEDEKRLGWDLNEVTRNHVSIINDNELIKLIADVVDVKPKDTPIDNPDLTLYSGGFLNKGDTARLRDIHTNGIILGYQKPTHWDDSRIPVQIKRCIARNYPDYLSEEDLQKWKEFCRTNIYNENFEINANNAEAKARELITDKNLLDDYIQFVNKIIYHANT